MEFGMFHEFQRRPGQTEAEAFTESFEQVDAAERAGLDVMWLAELHTAPERSVLAAPLNIASAIATRTRRMKIGIAVQVLPLCQPLRVAEEAATVDHISHGRLIMGVGRSGFPRTYQAYGISYAESRERFAEVLEILKRAWTNERFSFHGQFYHFDDVCLAPKPYQTPYPELRIAVNSPDTFQQSGEQGMPIFVATRLGDLNELVPNLRVYREAWAAAGHPGNGRIYLRVPVYVAATEKQAREEPQESVMFFYRYLGERIEASAGMVGARAIENRAERGARLQHIDYEEVLRSKIVVGTPAMVADRLAQLRDELGLSGILAELNCGMRISHDRVTNSLQMMCEQVIPHFRT
jgi:alkanesulfonate monooxygenase SsuD/methylene tetrahydromethanopterin reductase-like flavin-dependent oxidoreductase (luciferase family)